MSIIIKKILMKFVALMFITILPIALYIYIEDDIQFAWNINDANNTNNLNKYIMTVEVKPENKEMYVNEKVEFVNNTKKQLDKIYFYLFPQSIRTDDICLDLKSELGEQILKNEEPIMLDIRSIKRKGKILSYNIIGKKQNILMVKLDTQIKEGQKIDIEINGVLEFPHVTDKTSDGRAIYDIINWYPVIAQYDHGWILDTDGEHIEAVYSDEEYYLVEIIVPYGADVSIPGDLIDEKRKGDKKHFTYQSNKLNYFTFSIE
ncbi:hypothetical protein [Brassicibacter mesophilus]|uniref:hypothetical protein n=1 Tax=Brassicibacter mesophilus TaxID=745119 RepID=UPI003D22DB50